METKAEVQKRSNAEILVHLRQRKEYDFAEIKNLADSIRRTKGLIHPVVLDPEDESLVAGGRRRLAYMHLAAEFPDEGWQEIPFVYKGQEDELFRKVCELEENLQRLNLQWWEEAAAIAEIDEIQREIAEAKGETWNMRKTAEMTGKSLGTVQQSKELVKEAKTNPSVKDEKTLTGALQKVKTKKKLEERRKDLDRKKEGKIRTFPAEILVGDSLDLIRKEPDDEFDCIVTNFPFGVEYGYSGKADKVYDDDEDLIVDLVRSVVHESFRVLKNDSWFLGFFDIRKATYSNHQLVFVKEALELARAYERKSGGDWNGDQFRELAAKSLGLAHWFEEAGYSYVRLMPIVWAKPNKTQGNIGDPRKGLVVAYEVAILAAKGDAVLLKQGKQDLLIYDTLTAGSRDFEMQMPRELCKELVSWLVMGGARVLDTFAGVGSFGEGALDNQCSFRGYELNEERAATGNLRLQEHTFAQEQSDEGVHS